MRPSKFVVPAQAGARGKRMKFTGSHFRGNDAQTPKAQTRIAGIRDPGLTSRAERYPILTNLTAGTKGRARSR